MSIDAASGGMAAPDASRPDEPRAAMSPADPPPERGLTDLGQRALSAIVLIPIALGAAWAGGPWLAGAAGAAVVIMSYEWARMSEPDGLPLAWGLSLAGAFGAVVFASWNQMGWAAGLLATAGLISALRRPTNAKRLETLLGLLYIGAPPASFLWLRGQEPGGAMAVIGLFAVIWAADMAGYFGGRLLGGPKFAPAISPKKTWSGVVCSVLAGAAAGLGCAAVWHGPELLWAIIGVLLALIGLGGDLLESAIKRRFGVKDASRIIPGHGGMLDRLDGLMTATLAAATAIALDPGLLARLQGAVA